MMSDDVDKARAIEEATRRNATAAAIATLQRQGSEYCIDCGDRILEARREALPSAERCIDCQINFEGVGR
jgi:phage/conjugal plasmid C-4 type zinc finger TraR family protein